MLRLYDEELGMLNIAKGIYDKFNAVPRSGLWTSVNGRMSGGGGDQEEEFPNVKFKLSVIRRRTFDIKYDSYRVMFRIFSDRLSSLEALQIYGHIDALYGDDDLSLTIAGHRFIRMDLEITREPLEVPASISGMKVLWQLDADYILLVTVN